MALVGSRRRRVQIACTALALLVLAACAGLARADDGHSVPATRPVAATTTRLTHVALAASSSDVVGAFRALSEPKPPADEPTDNDTTDPPKVKKPTGKVIYLTFDDGPSVRYTRQILVLLDDYGAKATFFEIGANARAHPQLSRLVVARGHAIGNHTWNHPDLRKLGPRRMNRQITRTSDTLQRITGRPVTCLRPPYGAVNGRVKSALRHQKLAMKLWDIDPRDWRRPGAKAIAHRVVSHAKPGRVSLMHDGGGNRSQSVRALKRILRTLSKQGYEFKSLPGC